MATTRWNPTEDLRPLRAGSGVAAPADEHPSRLATPLAYDVYRYGDELCIDFDVPGIDPAGVQLCLEDRVLVVSVERELTPVGVDVIERGRAHGRFEQRLVLPREWGVEVLRASCTNGVLRVRAPLVRPRAARSIAIEARPAPLEPELSMSSVLGEDEGLAAPERERVSSVA